MREKELKEWVERSKPKIKVIGAGGGGNNTLTRLSKKGLKKIETIAVNTDAQHLLASIADKKILIGKKTTKGIGAGSNPKLGKEAALESIEELEKALKSCDLLFLTAGLGGGTGSGCLPVIANLAKRKNILTVALVTLPFSMEGEEKMKNALQALNELKVTVDSLIVVPNDKLLEKVPDLSLVSAFELVDEILINTLSGLTELLLNPGTINRDFADVKAVLKGGGFCLIGVGESGSEKRALEAVEKAVNNPLIFENPKHAKSSLVYITACLDLKVKEVEALINKVASYLKNNAKIIWGVSIDKSLGKKVKVLVILTGLDGLEEKLNLDLLGRKNAWRNR